MSESTTPFSSLITQLSQDITTASSLCEEIKKTRHVGKSHIQLDLLEGSLLAGPSFLDLSSTTFPDTLDEASRTSLESYISQIGEIIARLDVIAHPKSHHHSHHHRHHSRSLLFPDWDPVKHREKEDPHFGDLRAGWETVRDGIRVILGNVEGEGDVAEGMEKLSIKGEVGGEEKAETKVIVKEEVKTEAIEKTGSKKEVVKVNVEEFLVENEGKSEAVEA